MEIKKHMTGENNKTPSQALIKKYKIQINEEAFHQILKNKWNMSNIETNSFWLSDNFISKMGIKFKVKIIGRVDVLKVSLSILFAFWYKRILAAFLIFCSFLLYESNSLANIFALILILAVIGFAIYLSVLLIKRVFCRFFESLFKENNIVIKEIK